MVKICYRQIGAGICCEVVAQHIEHLLIQGPSTCTNFEDLKIVVGCLRISAKRSVYDLKYGILDSTSSTGLSRTPIRLQYVLCPAQIPQSVL